MDLLAQQQILKTEAARKEAEYLEEKRKIQEVVRVHLPAEIASAVKKEQAKCKREIKKIQDEMDLVARELAKEVVLRRAARSEWEEKLRLEKEKTAEAVA